MAGGCRACHARDVRSVPATHEIRVHGSFWGRRPSPTADRTLTGHQDVSQTHIGSFRAHPGGLPGPRPTAGRLCGSISCLGRTPRASRAWGARPEHLVRPGHAPGTDRRWDTRPNGHPSRHLLALATRGGPPATSTGTRRAATIGWCSVTVASGPASCCSIPTPTVPRSRTSRRCSWTRWQEAHPWTSSRASRRRTPPHGGPHGLRPSRTAGSACLRSRSLHGRDLLLEGPPRLPSIAAQAGRSAAALWIAPRNRLGTRASGRTLTRPAAAAIRSQVR